MIKRNFSENIIEFISGLEFPVALNEDIEVMNPFVNSDTMKTVETFYRKYYNDSDERFMILGINPGRFGGGITGIPFTDPIRLLDVCGINNSWTKKQELSSLFVYEVIEHYGGPEKFYKRFYISAVSPLGFTKENKNLNYYDDRKLQDSIKDFVKASMEKQLQFNINRSVAFCLGHGKNYQYLENLNSEMDYFESIVPLAHPRFIMQYKLKRKSEYIDQYLNQLSPPDDRSDGFKN